MKRKFTKCYVVVAVIIAVASVSAVQAQKYTLYLDSVKSVGKVDTLVTISLRTKNYTNVTGIQGSINWDTAVLSSNSISYGTSAINVASTDLNLADTSKGYITIGWLDANLNPETVADGTILLTFSFKVKKIIAGGGTTISLTNNPSPLTIIDANLTPITDTAYIPGFIGFSGSLPIILKDLAASSKENTVLLNWHTATELNSDHFIIQHSTDGSSFTDIGTVRAMGSGANNYEFTDTHPANGVNYYRLESVDKDGASSFSKVVSALLSTYDSRLTTFPNPAKSTVTISGSHIAFVQVIDNMGRVISVQVLHDVTNPSLNVSGLPAGVYHLRIQTTDGKVSGVGFIKE